MTLFRRRATDGIAAAARVERPVRPVSYVLISALFSVLLFGFFLVNDHGFLQARRQRIALARLQVEVSALAAENARLEEEVQGLKQDPAAVERIAREDLGLVKPGEVVLVLPKGWRERVAPSTPKR